MNDAAAREPVSPLVPDELAADLRIAVGTLVRAVRSSDRLPPIPGAVLYQLDRHGPMTTADLAAGRGVRHQTMAATVKELTESGLLAAGPDPSDARKKVLTLTAAGKDAIDADRRQRVSLLSRAIADTLDADEQRLLAQALILIDRLTEAVTDGDTPSAADSGPITGAW